MEYKTYRVAIFCENCGYTDEIEIKKGLQIQEEYCPLCECQKLVRTTMEKIYEDNFS